MIGWTVESSDTKIIVRISIEMRRTSTDTHSSDRISIHLERLIRTLTDTHRSIIQFIPVTIAMQHTLPHRRHQLSIIPKRYIAFSDT